MPTGYIAGNGSRSAAGENAIIASLNRNAFRRAGVLSINVMGGPGSGKTTLIVQTIAQLIPQWQAGVIAANSIFNPDIGRFDAVASQIAKLQLSSGATLMPHDIQAGLSQLDLSPLGVIFIENLGLFPDPGECDLGEEKRVAVFSVAAGADTAARHRQAVEWADAVILNKLDLVSLTAFDLESFRADVRRLNPDAKLFELSARKGHGFEEWAAWVGAQIHKGRV
ncbi:MAG TPA: hydrogenase nickel incorporation protein HypB [Tepidisphaeraceae bacterium]|jgi:hydrogenase nickel incorporation protein HypB|nr:hydrogenase nickel incorporation protein HypB [Tepidisphaeraceae bacterium]